MATVPEFPPTQNPAPLTPPVASSQWRRWGVLGLSLLFVVVRGVLISENIHQRAKTKHPVTAWHHEGTVARPDQLKGSGRIYLVQVGVHSDPYAVIDLAEWLRDKYALDVQVLPPMNVDPTAKDSARHQYVAERLYAQIKREHADLAADPHAYLFGFTDEEMYSVTGSSDYQFSLRDDRRAAMISSHGMAVNGWQRWLEPYASLPAHEADVRDRLRRILLKDVAVLYWHLPLNTDPGSLLAYSLNPRVPNDDIYESDLDPARYRWGAYVGDPCLVYSYSASAGLKRSEDSAGLFIQECEHPESMDNTQSTLDTDDPVPNISEERIELRLWIGLLMEKHTDFFLPGSIPIRFERALNNRYLMPLGFGLSGSHNYDRYLRPSSDAMRHIPIDNPGSGDVILKRVPAWMSNVNFAKWIDTAGSGSNLTMRWLATPEGHFELARWNGEVDSYLPCAGAQFCYFSGYRNGQGESLVVERDSYRRLMSLTAPHDNWLHFNYDPAAATKGRIANITDSGGRQITYRYNDRDQLAEVTYPSGEVISYTYDTLQNLLTVRATPHPGAAPILLVTNKYLKGRPVNQAFGDGSVYSYSYLPAGGDTAHSITVGAPDGSTYDLIFGDDGASVRRRSVGASPVTPTDHSL